MAEKPTKANPRTRIETFESRLDRLLPNPADAVPLLQLAQAKPNQPVPPEVLKAAEGVFTRVVAELKAGASALPPSKELDDLVAASDAQLRTILSKNADRFRELEEQWRKFRPLPEKKPGGGRPRTAAALIIPTAPPAAPTNVIATAGNASALVNWVAPAQPVTTYTVTPFIGAAAQASISVSGLTPFALVTGLTNGTAYTFKVKAANPLGTSPDSLPSNAVTPAAPATSVPFEPTIPPLTSEPVLQLDPAAETARALLTEAGRIGSKWRFEYLKAQAIRAAQESLAYETHITRLMQMTISKAVGAEEILNATLLDAAARLDQIASDVAQLSSQPAIDELLEPLSDAASEALLLPRILLFLARTSPMGFWIGLFEAMISDLASVFFSDTDFSRTRRFLRRVFEDDVDGIREGVQQAVQDLFQRLDEEVDRMIAPLQAAIAGVIGGTSQAMAAVFEAYDMPLLMNPPAPGSTFDVPDVDPLQERAQELASEVEKQADRIKQAIRDRLQPLLATPPNGDKFVIIAVTYLVIPILAFLVISLAGGPFSAALLAAVVLIAAQELVRLILKWLTGPLLKKVDEVRKLANDLIARLHRLFAVQADLVRNLSPELILEILSNQMRELRNLVPDEFVREASALLQAARDVVMRDGLELGLAAEQSLGIEHGTAFDVIRDVYLSALPKAAQLPAGTDPSLFAGAALLRDIGRLEQQRTSLQDGKEIEFPIRLSLFRLLGGDPLNVATPGEFSRFLSTREAVIRLTESDLLDDRYPGVYRALISEIRVLGIFNTAPLGSLTGGIPISITHLGESRTRVKRSANPAAPPLRLPECVRLTEEDFALQAASQAALQIAVERAFRTVPLTTRLAYLIALLFGGAAGAEAVGRPFQKAATEFVPASVAQRISAELDVCGFVDPASSRERTEQILRSMTWSNVIGALLEGTTAANLNQQPPFSNLTPVIAAVAQAIRTGQQGSANLQPGLEQVAREAYRAAVEAFQHRIGKWGGAYLEEDPDPQVRSLGFATLVRPMEAETAVFSLFPQAASALVRADSPAGVLNGPPVGAVSTQQYRPFENRGLDGRLLVRLEPGADALPQLSDQLSDLVIEVVVRALHDKDLASTVRASRQQRRGLLALAGRLPQVARTIIIPGTRPEVQAATGGLRTIRFSLRAQRDRTVDTWTTALQLDPALVPTIAGLGPLARLAPDAPFTPLRPLGTSPLNVALSFDDAAPAIPTETTLLNLDRTIRVSPLELGFPTNVLTAGRRIVEDAKLLSVGIAVIPTQDGVRPSGTLDDVAEPINLTLQVAAPLAAMLPGFSPTGTPLRKRLVMTPFPPAPAEPPAVRLVDLFDAATPPAITASIPAAAFGTPQRLYDVVFSLTFTVPTLLAATALDAIR